MSKMHVTLKLTAIKDGAVWQESELKYPGQDAAMYTELEKRLSDTLVKMGLDAVQLKSVSTVETATGVIR
jgi:hypothetical protein